MSALLILIFLHAAKLHMRWSVSTLAVGESVLKPSPFSCCPHATSLLFVTASCSTPGRLRWSFSSVSIHWVGNIVTPSSKSSSNNLPCMMTPAARSSHFSTLQLWTGLIFLWSWRPRYHTSGFSLPSVFGWFYWFLLESQFFHILSAMNAVLSLSSSESAPRLRLRVLSCACLRSSSLCKTRTPAPDVPERFQLDWSFPRKYGSTVSSGSSSSGPFFPSFFFLVLGCSCSSSRSAARGMSTVSCGMRFFSSGDTISYIWLASAMGSALELAEACSWILGTTCVSSNSDGS